jgi:V/A-type H+-transporting ATPase subunit E
MANTQNKLNSFISAVLNDAQERRKKILDELASMREAELQKAEKEILVEAYKYMHEELARISKDSSFKMSKVTLEYKRDLLKLRSEIINGVIEAVSEKLEKFSNSDEYISFLTSTAEKTSALLNSKPAFLMIRKEDFKYENELLKSFAAGSSAVIDENIALGGFRVKCPEAGIFIDETLDSKLTEQKNKFEENSGLYTA